jgi:hypothetical protein
MSAYNELENRIDELEAEVARLRSSKEALERLCSHIGILRAQEEHNALRAERDALRYWLQFCLDNCDDSPTWNFGTEATEQMRALLAQTTKAAPPHP